MSDDQSITLGKALDDPVEKDADRIADEWRRARPVDVTRLRHVEPTFPRNPNRGT
jgi:hypothetical protein